MDATNSAPAGEPDSVQIEEWRRVRRRRQAAFQLEGVEERNLDSEERPRQVVGLALSGGGLRSALFNDGFLQAISHKGLLRYVDYLASVSGGGYIAGHLMTYSKVAPQESEERDEQRQDEQGQDEQVQTRPKEETPLGFHDREADWGLGRAPRSGLESADHLPAIGRYLSQSLRFAGGYLLHQLPVMGCYLATVGVFGTLVAILYRSFDEPLFRAIYHSALNINFGGECFIAFLPTLILTAVLMVLHFGYRALGGRAADALHRCLSYSVVAVLVGAIASVAVFLGNGLTSVGNEQQTPWHLNSFATYIAIFAGLVQIIVFLGKDRLFESERSEAANWKKAAQAVISHGVALFLVFAMIHVMAQEDISDYTENRDSYLVRGEVIDWPHVDGVFERCRQSSAAARPTGPEPWGSAERMEMLVYGHWLTVHWRGASTAEAYWREHLSDEDADPPSPAERAAERRGNLSGAVTRAWGLLVALSPWTPNVSAEPLRPELKESQGMRGVAAAAAQIHRNQAAYLRDHNRLMESDLLTRRLLEILIPELDPAADSSTWQLLNGREAVKRRLAALPSERRKRLAERLWVHDVGTLAFSPIDWRAGPWWAVWVNSRGDEPPSPGVLERVRLNRDLLELSGPDVLKPLHVASTPVVQPHDQRARWRWLAGWLTLLCLTLIGTRDLNDVGYMFKHYQDSIAEHFLRRPSSDAGGGLFVDGKTPLRDLNPHHQGLPFPIYLAAWLKMETRHRSFYISPQCISLTPLELRLRNDEEGRQDFSRPLTADFQPLGPRMKLFKRRHDAELTLSDAVATSGSAVTPLMTSNVSLMALMDFFGARLGTWIKHPGRQWARRDDLLPLMLLLTLPLIACLVALPLSSYVFVPLVALLLVELVCISIYFDAGYPRIVLSFLGQLLSRSCDDDGRKHWPRMFAADGGFYDFLGVTELMRRRCELILVSDAGCNTGRTTFESLARMCERASARLGVRFVDLDHESPIDFNRLRRNDDQCAAQPFLVMRVLYPPSKDEPSAPREGLLIFAQMAITASDPIEIQQIRNRFPSFPDEPTTNQFYTDEQVAAYRHLGYHVGKRVCSQLQRWSPAELRGPECGGQMSPAANVTDSQPGFAEVGRRLRRSYVQACFEEFYYRDDDIYGESIWREKDSQEGCYPSLDAAIAELHRNTLDSQCSTFTAADYWLTRFTENADVFTCYLQWVNREVNRLQETVEVRSDASHDRAPDSEDTTGVEDRPDGKTLPGQLRRQSDDGAGVGERRSDSNAVAAAKKEIGTGADVPRSPLLWKRVCGAGRQERDPLCLKSSDAEAKGLGVPPQRKRLWGAHLAVLAAACQQLHRGVPNAIFQIDGRRKLCSLVEKLVDDFADKSSEVHRPGNDPAAVADVIARALVNEIYELNESVFQSADTVTVISFVQCLCNELRRLIPGPPAANDEQASKPLAADDEAKPPPYRLDVDFRQLLMEALQSGFPSRAQKLIAAYLLSLADPSRNDYFTNEIALSREITSRLTTASAVRPR